MKEQLVAFETAKLAKNKGFNQHSNNYKYHKYLENDEYDDPRSGNVIVFRKKGEVVLFQGYADVKTESWLAPTQSLLQKWLREVHEIYVNPSLFRNYPDDKPCGFYTGEIFNKEGKIIYEGDDTFIKYEEALEKGLFEALKLIE